MPCSKTLEEPTRGTVIVLVSNAPGRLVATIPLALPASKFKPPSRRQMLWRGGRPGAEGAASLDAASGNPGAPWPWRDRAASPYARRWRATWRRCGRVSAPPAKRPAAGPGREGELRLWFAAQLAVDRQPPRRVARAVRSP